MVKTVVVRSGLRRNDKYGFTICSAILLFFCSVYATHAEVFKWVDENGKVIYGDRPSVEDAEKIEIKEAPVQDPILQKRAKTRDKLLNAYQEERDEKHAGQEVEAVNREKMDVACKNAKEELRKLRDVNILYEKTDNPDEPRAISESERETRRLAQEKIIKENC